MAHIHNQSNAVHFRHHLAAHAGQAGIVILITPSRQQRLIVIGQLHKPQAQRVQNFNQSNIILDTGRVLRPKEYCRATRFTRPINIGGSAALHDQVGELFKPTVPFFDIQNGFAKGFVIRDRDMHRINATFAHLAKHFFRPICILQTIDD